MNLQHKENKNGSNLGPNKYFHNFSLKGSSGGIQEHTESARWGLPGPL